MFVKQRPILLPMFLYIWKADRVLFFSLPYDGIKTYPVCSVGKQRVHIGIYSTGSTKSISFYTRNLHQSMNGITREAQKMFHSNTCCVFCLGNTPQKAAQRLRPTWNKPSRFLPGTPPRLRK